MTLAIILSSSVLAFAGTDPCPSERTVAVEVVSELGDEHDDAAMREYVTARLPAQAANEGVCVDPVAPRRVELTIAWSDAARGSYAIHLRAQSPEHATPVELPAGTCEGCSTAELVAHGAAHLPEALEALVPPRAPAAEHEPAPPPRITTPTLDRPPARRRLTRLGHAGIGVAATGCAALAAGAGLWAQGDIVHPRDANYRLSLRPVGISFVVAGAITTAAGATMLALDLRPAKRLVFSPTINGAVITGRF